MTEAEWNTSRDPQAMLAFLRSHDGTSQRKLRLFAATCFRGRICTADDELAVAVGEHYADGSATEVERRVLFETVELLKREAVDRQDFEEAAHLWMRQGAITGELWRWVFGLARCVPNSYGALRDIFGPLPFRSIQFDPLLFAGPALTLAQTAYDERQMPSGHLDNARLAVLADMLEEAGCRDAEVLGHLRGPQAVHVRGCWCVDVLTGKQ